MLQNGVMFPYPISLWQVRQAVKLIRGLRIDADDTTFTLQVLSVLSWFKVRTALRGGCEDEECTAFTCMVSLCCLDLK
jgi:ATP sulfurylase